MFNCMGNSMYSNLYMGTPFAVPMGIGMMGVGKKDPNGGSLIYGSNINKTVGLNTTSDNYCDTIKEKNAKKKKIWKTIGLTAAAIAGFIILKKPVGKLLTKAISFIGGKTATTAAGAATTGGNLLPMITNGIKKAGSLFTGNTVTDVAGALTTKGNAITKFAGAMTAIGTAASSIKGIFTDNKGVVDSLDKGGRAIAGIGNAITTGSDAINNFTGVSNKKTSTGDILSQIKNQADVKAHFTELFGKSEAELIATMDKKEYRQLAQKYHPDKFGGNNAGAKEVFSYLADIAQKAGVV